MNTQCPKCKEDMTQHVDITENGLEINTIQCPKCNMVFTSMDALAKYKKFYFAHYIEENQ